MPPKFKVNVASGTEGDQAKVASGEYNNVELSYVSSQNALFRATVDIYKTMGGSWIEAAEQTVTPAPEKEAGFFPCGREQLLSEISEHASEYRTRNESKSSS